MVRLILLILTFDWRLSVTFILFFILSARYDQHCGWPTDGESAATPAGTTQKQHQGSPDLQTIHSIPGHPETRSGKRRQSGPLVWSERWDKWIEERVKREISGKLAVYHDLSCFYDIWRDIQEKRPRPNCPDVAARKGLHNWQYRKILLVNLVY